MHAHFKQLSVICLMMGFLMLLVLTPIHELHAQNNRSGFSQIDFDNLNKPKSTPHPTYDNPIEKLLSEVAPEKKKKKKKRKARPIKKRSQKRDLLDLPKNKKRHFAIE